MDKKIIHYCKCNMGGGVNWLDKHFPGWRYKIDTHILNMESKVNDILGQLWEHSDFSPIVLELEEGGKTKIQILRSISAMGFAISDKHKDPDTAYKALTSLWVEEVNNHESVNPLAFLQRFKEAV